MFSKLFTLGGFFAKFEVTVEHDVEAIIASFTNTVTKLEAAAVAKLKEATHFEQLSADAEKAMDDAHAASEKATAIATKIKALVA